MSLTIIAAVAENNVIGNSEIRELPWKNPSEMRFFREVTIGKTIVMGTITALETRKLSGRNCLVLSRDKDCLVEGFATVALDDLLTMNERNFKEEIMVCGGASVYEVLMPYCSEAIISHMKFKSHGDIKLPEFKPSIWKRGREQDFEDFTVMRYVNTDRTKHYLLQEDKSPITNT